jgi:hypothetical protein
MQSNEILSQYSLVKHFSLISTFSGLGGVCSKKLIRQKSIGLTEPYQILSDLL